MLTNRSFTNITPRPACSPPLTRLILSCTLALGVLFAGTPVTSSQDTVTGAFEGTVTNSQTGAIISGASVQIINQQTNQTTPKTSDSRGRFYAGLLAPGIYL